MLARVISSIISKKAKYFILGLIFFLVGNFLVIAIGINDASSSAIDLSRKNLNPVIVLENSDEYFNLDDEVIENINVVKNEIVEDERILVYNKLHFENLYPSISEPIALKQQKDNPRVTKNGMKLICNNTDGMIEIDDGTYEIIEGRFYNQGEINSGAQVMLITKDFAEFNNIKLGDTISFTSLYEIEKVSKYFDNGFDGMIDFEVIGIFNNNESTNEKNYSQAIDLPTNALLSPFSSIEQYIDLCNNYSMQYMNEVSNSNDVLTNNVYDLYQYVNPVIKLSDPDDLEQFVSDYQDKLNPIIILNSNNDAFISYGKPLEIITYFSDFLMMFVVMNMVIMICSIICIFVKMREIEIGILLSMGINKLNIIIQIILEVVIVGMIGISLSLFTGKILAQQYGDDVLKLSVVQKNISEDASNENYFGNVTGLQQKDYFSNISQDDIFDNFIVDISISTACNIYSVSLLIILISSILPSILIMILEPNKILAHKD